MAAITALTLTPAVNSASAPYTFGHPFRQGDVPAGADVLGTGTDFQCVKKTYWPDGSLKFGVLSGRIAATAGSPVAVALSTGTAAAGTSLTLADLKATNITAAIALTNAKDWTFDTNAETVGVRLSMSNVLDVFDAASSTITVDNSATISSLTAVQDVAAITCVLTATLSGGTVDGYQTVRYRMKYKPRRAITAITNAAVARITVASGWRTASSTSSDGLGVAIMAVGNTVTFSGITGMTQLNGMTGTVTAVDSGSGKAWFEVNINTTAMGTYTSGGFAAKNELNTSDFDDIAYVRTGGGLAWDGLKCTYSPTNTTAQTGVSWSGTDWDTPFEQLESGPVMSSWKFRKAITPDPHMVAWLEVRVYKGGAVDVWPYLENGYLNVPRPTAKQANIALSINGVEKFNQLLEIKAHSRTVLINGTHLAYWNIPDPLIYPKHDRAYVYATRMIPTAANVTPDNASTITSLPATFVPFQRGNWQAAMGSAGFQADIGVIPNHDALYFSNGSIRSFEGMLRNAMGSGRYRFHYRDETTNRPLKFSSYPNLVVNGTGSGIGNPGTSSTNSFTPIECGGTASGAQFISSHVPGFGYTPYMVTARDYFKEEMQFLSTLLYLKQVDSNGGRMFSKGILRPEVGANQTRGCAWARRTLAQAAALTASSDPLAIELTTSLEENVLFDHAKYIVTPNCPFGFMELYTNYGANEIRGSGFQTDFMTAAIGHMLNIAPLLNDSTRTKLAEVFAWKAKSAIGRLGGTGPDEFLFRDSGEYAIPLGPNMMDATDFDTGVGPWLANWGEVWNVLFPDGVREDGPLRGGNFPSAGSYQANLLPAIAAAVEHNVPGALTAYNRLVGASNWSQQNATLIAHPVYGIAPATLPYVAPVDPVPDPDPAPDPVPDPTPQEPIIMPIAFTDIKLRQSGAANLGGVISTTDVGSNMFDDVQGPEATAGRTEYRCAYVYNAHPTDTMTGTVVWIVANTPSISTAIEIGIGSASLNAVEQTIANETTAPLGVTFVAGDTKATGVSLGDIPPLGFRSVWYRRTTAPGATARTSDTWTPRVESGGG